MLKHTWKLRGKKGWFAENNGLGRNEFSSGKLVKIITDVFVPKN